MNPTEVYKACVNRANIDTLEKFGVHGPYEPGSAEHDYWLSRFDAVHTANS